MKKGLILTLLTVVLTSLLCIGLYRMDNKYTHQSPQPINGILFSEESLTYLTRQWMVYPDVLLTPEEVSEYQGYRYYKNIGENGKNKSGSMTYRLTLLLPEEIHEYALELPEVFSACRLYVNDRLLLQLGEPSPETYQEGLSSRIVTFSASGKTELLLAVSDFSGINCGLTYPPAFGNADYVLVARELRLFLHGGLVLLALLGAVLSITFGIKGQQKRGILGSLLCLCLAVVTGYPLYHSMLITAVQPWYTLEPACYYALLLLALLLQCTIYETPPKTRLYLSIPCIIGFTSALISFGGASMLPENTSHIFSLLSEGLKYYTALALLVLSLWALRKEKCHSLLLLCGSAALATCLLWDRFLPLYEPIYSGWFGEIGGSFLVLSLTTALWLDAIDAYKFRMTYEASLLQIEQRLVLQKNHYQQLSEQVQLAREAGHDLRHHMRTLRSFAEQGQWHQLKTYLNNYESHLQKRQLVIYSEHMTADAVLSHYATLTNTKNAVFDVRMNIPPDLPFPDDELCIVLSNLLENALEAVSKDTYEVSFIHLRGEVVNGNLGIIMDNSCNTERTCKNSIFLSTKGETHGLGLRSIETIVKKYGGLADFRAENGVFHSSILIPIPSPPDFS